MTRPRPVQVSPVSGRRPPCPGRGPGWRVRRPILFQLSRTQSRRGSRSHQPPAVQIFINTRLIYITVTDSGKWEAVTEFTTIQLVQWNQKHSWNYIENEPLSLFLSWQFEPRPSTSCSDQTSSSSASSGLQKTLHFIIDYLGDGAQQSVHSPALSPIAQLFLRCSKTDRK